MTGRSFLRRNEVLSFNPHCLIYEVSGTSPTDTPLTRLSLMANGVTWNLENKQNPLVCTTVYLNSYFPCYLECWQALIKQKMLIQSPSSWKLQGTHLPLMLGIQKELDSVGSSEQNTACCENARGFCFHTVSGRIQKLLSNIFINKPSDKSQSFLT